jgi:hypothetical protein
MMAAAAHNAKPLHVLRVTLVLKIELLVVVV